MIVSLAVLGILLGSLTTTMVNVLDLTRNNANRTIAANLAASAIEELRALPYTELEDLADTDPDPTWTEEIDGREFTLSREIFWSTNLADAGTCLGSIGPSDENILRLSVDVTWVRPRGTPPVRSETAVSPPVSPDSSSSGTIAVQVKDHQAPPEPVAAVEVTLTGPEPSTTSRVETTDSDGCAVFQGLTRGNYEASLDKAAPSPFAYVDLDQKQHPDVVRGIGTAPRIWANLEFRYAVSGELTVEMDGWAPDSRLPTDPLPWYAANERDGSPYVFPATGQPAQLYPGLYDIGVGHCTDSSVSPRVGDAAVVPSADQFTYDATIGSFEVRWSPDVLDALAEDTVDARSVSLVALPPPDECFSEAGEIGLPGIVEGEVATYALPFADGWTIEARSGGDTLDARTVDLSPDDDPTLPFVEFDYEIDIDPTVPGCGGLFDVMPTVLQATGGATEVITVDGSPWCLHRFEEVGPSTFNVTGGSGEVQYLVVAGGGGGGGNPTGNVGRGGGGAGGMLLGSTSITGPRADTVVVGSGGSGGTGSGGSSGQPGGDSQFDSLVAIGGGGGGNFRGVAGDGGSGGGEGVDGSGGPGSGEVGQGNDGGSGSSDVAIGRGGGGGGGAGAVGGSVTTSSNDGADGGSGLSSDITGVTVTYAGGGGGSGGNSGGAGGTGGGGDGGSDDVAPTPGAANTGGGGGGGIGSAGAAGGSGVVYIRYPLEEGVELPDPPGPDCGAEPTVLDTAETRAIAVPSGCTQMSVQAWGAGGGGGATISGSGFRPSGHGGGGGAFASAVFSVAPGQSVVATAGAGGAGNQDGSDSTVSLAGTEILRAAAGEGGSAGAGSSPGSGGSVAASSIVAGATDPVLQPGGDGGVRGTYPGPSSTDNSGGQYGGGGGGGGSATPTGAGQTGEEATALIGGDGGSGQGDGGHGGDDVDASSTRPAQSGRSPGGGGGGTGWVNFDPTPAPGADGRVVIVWSGS